MSGNFNESVSIDVDWKSIEEKLKKLNDVAKNGFDKGLKETLNEVISPSGGEDMKKFALKKMRDIYTIKTRRLDKNGKVQTEKATQSKLSASVYTMGRPNSLTYFSHSPTEKSVKKKGRKNVGVTKAHCFQKKNLVTIPKAFVATMQNGHYGMFRNLTSESRIVPKSGTYAGKKYKRNRRRNDGTMAIAGQPYERVGMKQLYGPGTSQMLYHKDVSQSIIKEMEDRFDKAVDKAIDKVIQKAMK